jgi:hypothetical protein
MLPSSIASKAMQADGYKVVRYDDGDVHSFSSLDRGVDPVAIIRDNRSDQALFRRRLGDISFLIREDSGGSIDDLFYVPEYPNFILGELRRAVTCYGFSLLSPDRNQAIELALADPSIKRIDWSDAGKILAGRNADSFNTLQKEILQAIAEINRRTETEHPNVTRASMRRQVGPPRGARVYTQPIIFGYV